MAAGCFVLYFYHAVKFSAYVSHTARDSHSARTKRTDVWLKLAHDFQSNWRLFQRKADLRVKKSIFFRRLTDMSASD
ncbi:MAG: hypothetical protein EAZ34_06125 [Polaromonas sp.]|nr:MAG: hypothetical protein EAZ34_06125 [Polaromonas sp.]